jgi:hypothetical protein
MLGKKMGIFFSTSTKGGNRFLKGWEDGSVEK